MEIAPTRAHAAATMATIFFLLSTSFVSTGASGTDRWVPETISNMRPSTLTRPYKLIDLTSTESRSHTMRVMLRLPESYGFYTECSTPSAIYGVDTFANETSADAEESAASKKSVARCDSGKAQCRGIPCNFLVGAHVGISCAHLSVVWGCHNCLQCSECSASEGHQRGHSPAVCPACSNLQRCPANGADAAWQSAVRECVTANAGAFVDGSEAAGQHVPVLSIIIDDSADDSYAPCTAPQDIDAVDWSAVFPLFVHEMPLHSVVAMMVTSSPATGRRRALASAGGDTLGVSNATEFLETAAALMMKTYVAAANACSSVQAE